MLNCNLLLCLLFFNDANKRKMLGPRPRPRLVKQQHEYITEKRPVTFGTVSALIARKNTRVYYISAFHSASRRAQQCWKQDQKYNTKTKTKTKAARPRPRPRPVWDRSCYKTAVSDPKTAAFSRWPIWK